MHIVVRIYGHSSVDLFKSRWCCWYGVYTEKSNSNLDSDWKSVNRIIEMTADWSRIKLPYLAKSQLLLSWLLQLKTTNTTIPPSTNKTTSVQHTIQLAYMLFSLFLFCTKPFASCFVGFWRDAVGNCQVIKRKEESKHHHHHPNPF